MAAIKALEQWCKTQCEGYRDVAITNMTSSFRNGMAFCALIHKYRPDLIDYDSLQKDDVFKNNKLAFEIAEEKLGIPALLDAEDMVALRIPDRLSILTYVSQYYNYFKGRSPIGGVKRPAEGSKEEPSEKKNLPVVAKTFVSKTAIENCPRSHSSPKVDGAAVQMPVQAENPSKNGTLNSKCVSCKTHVHLVQRHFVEGRLYHRSCFKCHDCSSVLHAGGYKPGKIPDTFICSTHHYNSKSSTSDIKKGPPSSAVQPNSASQTPSAPRASSVLSAPLTIVQKPVSPTPPSESWTPSAQKTQAARQRFFQSVTPITKVRKPVETTSVAGRPKVPVVPEDEKTRTRTNTGKKLAEENCNNNNMRLFTIRSADRRFGDEPHSVNSLGWRQDKCSHGAAGNWAGPLSTSQTNNKESSHLKAIYKDHASPTNAPTTAKVPVGQEEQLELKHVKSEEAEEKQHKPEFKSVTSSNVSCVIVGSHLDPAPAVVSPVGCSLFDSVQHSEDVSRKPQPTSGNLVFNHGSPSPVKSPPRRPAVASSSSASADPGDPSAAKKGKYLSPTNTSKTEMRSPSVRTFHLPAEQIERELNEIETNLAQLEKEGVELEKKLRSCEEEGDGDVLMDPLMVDWFNLIRQKQMYIRKESELVYIARTQELEQQQPDVEEELRRLLEKPDHLKSRDEQLQEKKLMQRLMEIVEGRNAIVLGLDEDRLREVEEDQQLNEMMKNLGVKKGKHKRKSSISKLFRRRSKRRVE